MQRACFLDRDGVINVDEGYVGTIERFHFIPGIFEALQKLQQRGFKLIVVTNQSGIARGYYSHEEYERLTRYMLEKFAKRGIEIMAVYHCPHHPDENCDCRKPKPGMIVRAAREHNIDLASSWLVGDTMKDIEAAQRAGIKNMVLLDNKRLIDVVEEIV